MSAVTLETLDYALRLTHLQWVAAIKDGQLDRAKCAQARLDNLLDQRCVAANK